MLLNAQRASPTSTRNIPVLLQMAHTSTNGNSFDTAFMVEIFLAEKFVVGNLEY